MPKSREAKGHVHRRECKNGVNARAQRDRKNRHYTWHIIRGENFAQDSNKLHLHTDT